MSRPSTGAGGPGRFQVFDADTDAYNHTQVAANWDANDAVLGGPLNWPGSGNSVYTELQNLKKDRIPLGVIEWWYRPSPNVPVPTGWVVCDGKTTLAGSQHGFVDANGVSIGTFSVPDLRNSIPIGARQTIADNSQTAADLAPSSVGNAYTNAPGIGGQGGTNDLVSVPAHYHQHDHVHEVNVSSGYETSDASGNATDRAANGTAVNVSRPDHNHHIDLYSSSPRNPANANVKPSQVVGPDDSQTVRRQTSLQKKADGNSDTIDPTGGNAGDALSLDARPKHFGLLPLMKVLFSS